MAQETALTLKIDLRTDAVEAGFKKTEQQAQRVGAQVSRAFNEGSKSIESITVTAKQAASSFDALGNVVKGLVGIAGTLTAAFGAVAGVIKLIKIDEANAQSMRSFEVAAKGAGVSSESLAQSLNLARRGFADLEDVLQASTRVLNEVGAEVGDKLPKLLDIATKASVRFGIDTIYAYDKLTQAVVTGSTKQLRAFGIYVDASKAAREYAKSIGLTADQLTEAEKRQATLNAILSSGERAFKGVDTSQKTVTQSLIELKNSINETIEVIASLVNKTLGPLLQRGISELNTFVKNLADALTPPKDRRDELLQSLTDINKKIFELQQQAEKGPSIGQRLFGFFDRLAGNQAALTINEQIKALQNSKQAILSELDKINKETQAKQVSNAQETARVVSEADLQARQIILTNQEAFNKRLDELRLAARQAEINALLVTATEEERLRLQTELLELEHQRRLEQIRNEFRAKRGISEAQVNLLLEAETTRHLAAVSALQSQFYQNAAKQKTQFDQFIVQSTQAVNQALVSLISNATQRIGASLIQGGNAWQNFGATILNIIGDLLINIGQAAIAIGIMIDRVRDSLVTFFGGNAIAAGLAAIALGGILKAVASSMMGSGFKAGPTPTFGGGVTNVGGAPVTQPVITETELQERETERQTQANVTVTINGDVLDSDETGTRIVNLINQAFDKQGVVIRRGVMSYA